MKLWMNGSAPEELLPPRRPQLTVRQVGVNPERWYWKFDPADGHVAPYTGFKDTHEAAVAEGRRVRANYLVAKNSEIEVIE